MRILFLGFYKSPAFLQWDGQQGSDLGGQRKIGLLLRALLASGHEVRVVSSAVSARNRREWQKQLKTTVDFPEGRVSVIHSGTTGLKPWGGLLTCFTTRQVVLGLASEWKPDIAFSYNGLLAETISLLALRNRFGTPFVVEVDDYPGVRARGWNPKAKMDVFGWHFLEPKASGFVLVNSKLRDKVPTGGRPFVILPGIVEDALIEQSKKRRDPFASKQRTLLYCGGLSVERGAGRLLAAIPFLPPDWRLVVAGSGPLLARFQEQAELAPERCAFLGLLSSSQMIPVLCAADTVINPPETLNHADGVFPVKIFEYIASRAHLISTKLPKVEGADLTWFQRWSGEPEELRTLLSNAESDYQQEKAVRETAIRWVNQEFSIRQVSLKLNGIFSAIAK
jgi:glycosyltransferase involved in cell wall biosynthesis